MRSSPDPRFTIQEIQFGAPLKGTVYPIVVWIWHSFRSKQATAAPDEDGFIQDQGYVVLREVPGAAMLESSRMILQRL